MLIVIIFLIIVGYFLYTQSKCNNYHFSNCPSGCTQICTSSGLNTTDCDDGPESCAPLFVLFTKKMDSHDRREWTQCKNKALPADFEIHWKVEVKDTSSFGGFYVKGYLEGDKSYPVHITFDTGIGSELDSGDWLKLKGRCVGVIEKRDVWVKATDYGTYE